MKKTIWIIVILLAGLTLYFVLKQQKTKEIPTVPLINKVEESQKPLREYNECLDNPEAEGCGKGLNYESDLHG